MEVGLETAPEVDRCWLVAAGLAARTALMLLLTNSRTRMALRVNASDAAVASVARAVLPTQNSEPRVELQPCCLHAP